MPLFGKIEPLKNVLICRPGDGDYKTGRFAQCETCQTPITDGLQISILSAGHDHTLFCLDCWRAAVVIIEQVAGTVEG